MSVKFESNTYFSSVINESKFENDKEIIKYANNNPQFHFGNVDLKKFSSKYTDNGWLRRKFTALPYALWSGIVKVVYHVAKAFFIGIPKAIFNDTRYIKAQVFSVIRDLQESFGHIASIPSDRFGAFHVQEAKFQKACYDCFAIKNKPSSSNNNSPTEAEILAKHPGMQGLSDAIEELENLQAEKKKNDPLVRCQQAEEYFEKGDRENALKEVEKVGLEGFMECFFYEKDKTKAIIEIVGKLVNSYLEEYDLINAKRANSLIIGKEHNAFDRAIFLAKTADVLYEKGHKARALECINQIPCDSRIKDALIANLETCRTEV